MFRKKIVNFFGTALLFVGFALAFLPHAIHSSIGVGNSIPHLQHVIAGIVIIIISLIVLVHNNDALNREFFTKFILKRDK